MKKLNRQEVLKLVRFTNKFYRPSTHQTYSFDDEEYYPSDLELLRYKGNDYVLVKELGNLHYYCRVQNWRKGNFYPDWCTDYRNLCDLTNCGNGFLKG